MKEAVRVHQGLGTAFLVVRSEGGPSKGGQAEIRETARIELEGDSLKPSVGGGAGLVIPLSPGVLFT